MRGVGGCLFGVGGERNYARGNKRKWGRLPEAEAKADQGV